MNKPLLAALAVFALAALEAVSLLFGAVPLEADAASKTAFPHAAHARLFPNCTACHAGVAAGDTTRSFTVRQQDCARCHDGSVQPVVAWSPPPPRRDNLRFSHRVHAAASVECAACHAASPGAARMEVTMPNAERCLECHGGTPHHAPATRCDVCHAPISAAPQVLEAAIAGYALPEDHRDPAFVHVHGEAAIATPNRCAVCHAQESCERCHMDGARLPAIAALAKDPRIAALVAGKPGAWPEPADHRDHRWPFVHGKAARADAQSCANCHEQSSCTGCHAELPPAGIDALPALAPADPRGVRLPAARPPHHPPGFDVHHATAAATRVLRCDACHSESSCAGCHEAAFEPVFHPRDYRSRHAAEVYARDSDCSSCHSTEGFCRDCHASSGVATFDSRTSAYHDAQPLWLLNHGRAARQSMESCASCHQQTDCLQCHSARSGWRVNPHGPDFDADRMADRSQESCAVCHLAAPRRK